ncbi:MAG TPA: histidine kinase [Cyclobacteriaceae bacterium]|nr:histidine kinase [Cyclobacteriaceae bacterium]
MSKPFSVFRGNFSYHLLVWVLLIIPNVFGSTYLLRAGVTTYIATIFLRNGVLLAVVYINFLVLIPKFFRKGRYLTFSVLILILVGLAVTAIASLDMYTSAKMGFKPMADEDFYVEVAFYGFNMCSYVLTSFLLFSLREKQEQKETLDQVQLEKLGAEIKYLRAQINPHFLFNTLNNLYGMALEKSEKTPEIILKLSRIMDYMLYESNDVKVYLKNDIDNIRNYVDIERIRQGNNAEIVFDVKGNIGSETIVPLMLLPLVENAFKHGVNTIINGAYMHVNINVSGNDLEMDVKNNFKTVTDDTQRNGIGLVNLERRLDLFYPKAHSMKVETTGDYYHVNLKLRLA